MLDPPVFLALFVSIVTLVITYITSRKTALLEDVESLRAKVSQLEKDLEEAGKKLLRCEEAHHLLTRENIELMRQILLKGPT